MEKSRFLIIDKEILPDIFEKVVEAKELIKTDKVKGVTEAAKVVGISRSAFYKYRDYVYPLSGSSVGNKVTLSFLLTHKSGILSNVLKVISNNDCNILTINQESPVKDVANVSLAFDTTYMDTKLENIIGEIGDVEGVERVELIAIE